MPTDIMLGDDAIRMFATAQTRTMTWCDAAPIDF